ncbi:MAG: hypothetical protein HY293_10955 [Planctomycetes bacterium]|nr:hypothetical protein [Planctomycetota bacterium]
MEGSRDPWLAANLSWSFAGLGQLYARKWLSGALFLLLEVALWAALLAGLLNPRLSLADLLVVVAAQLALWSVSAALAHRVLEASSPGNPWKAVFLSRLLPGWGQIYAGGLLRGLAMAGGCVALFVYGSSYVNGMAGAFGFLALRALVVLHAFLMLRRQNRASGPATAWTLLLILLLSQGWTLSLLLQATIAGSYKIPSSAMEPTLMGDLSESHPKEYCPFAFLHASPSGDRILVSKTAYAFSPIRRFDVAVFRFPLNQSKPFVKRVVGLPEEELLIHGGDLYVRPADGSRFEIARKRLETQDRIWIRIHQDADSAADPATFRQYWSGAEGEVSAAPQGGLRLPASKSGKGVEFVPPIEDPTHQPVGDLRLSFDVHVDHGTEIFARIVNQYGRLELLMPIGRPGVLRVERAGKAPELLPLGTSPLPMGRWCSLELMVFDGQAVVRMDSTLLGQIPLLSSVEEARALKEVRTAVSFGARDVGVSLRRVRIDRDLFYRGRDREHGLREDEPLKIPAGHYVLFGDNVQNSHDSRAWVKRTFVLKDGRRIVCEAQQVNEAYSRFSSQMKDRHHLAEAPRYAIDGDEQGNEVAITQEQLLREEEPQPFRFVDRRFFIGRVVRIWSPAAREGPVR